MMHAILSLNYPAVRVVTVVGFLLGRFWHFPVLFAQPGMTACLRHPGDPWWCYFANASARVAMMSSTGSAPTERRSRSGSMPLAASSARPAAFFTRS